MAMRQEMKGSAAESDHEVKHIQAGTTAEMRNKTPTTMVLSRRMDWYGFPSGTGYPSTIPHGGSASFIHTNTLNGQSKGAVQYDGVNAAAKEQCAWILAWDVPFSETSLTPNKVYAICGPKTRIDAITWDQILVSLDKGSLHANYSDTATNTNVDALITDDMSSYAPLTATFGLTK